MLYNKQNNKVNMPSHYCGGSFSTKVKHNYIRRLQDWQQRGKTNKAESFSIPETARKMLQREAIKFHNHSVPEVDDLLCQVSGQIIYLLQIYWKAIGKFLSRESPKGRPFLLHLQNRLLIAVVIP